MPNHIKSVCHFYVNKPSFILLNFILSLAVKYANAHITNFTVSEAEFSCYMVSFKFKFYFRLFLIDEFDRNNPLIIE